MRKHRAPLPLLWSIAIHVAVGIALANAAFHYDLLSLQEPRVPGPAQERVTYVATLPSGGAAGGSGSSAPAKSATPSAGLVAPVRTRTSIAPAPRSGGTPGGITNGRGMGGGRGVMTGIVPAQPDPRLIYDERAFYPAPKSHAQRVDSAVRANIFAYNDSVARAAARAGKKPGDWTFEKNGQKWGVDGNKIYLGKFAIPSAVLAALPIHIQGNPGESIADRLSTTRRSDLQLHAASQYQGEEFKTAVKRIRERKDRERRERQGGDARLPVAEAPDGK